MCKRAFGTSTKIEVCNSNKGLSRELAHLFIREVEFMDYDGVHVVVRQQVICQKRHGLIHLYLVVMWSIVTCRNIAI